MVMKSGFPRPRMFVERTSRHPSKGSYGKKWNNKSYPHPYSASDTSIADINAERLRECVVDSKCGTCGDPVAQDEFVGLILWNQRSIKTKAEKGWLNSESGPYHLKCLIINFTQCPHLVETQQFIPGCGVWSEVQPQMVAEFYPSSKSRA